MTPDDAGSRSTDPLSRASLPDDGARRSASPTGSPLPDDAARPGDAGAVGAGRAGRRVVAVVPLRDGSSGKSRLAGVLDPTERSRLIASLARHVVGTLLASESVERVLVVTSDPRFTWRALGSLVAPTPPPTVTPQPPTATAPPAEGDGSPAEGDTPTTEGDVSDRRPPTATDSPAEGDGPVAEGDASIDDAGPGRLQIVLQPASRPGLNAALDVGRDLVTSAAESPGGDSAASDVRLLIAHADLPALTTEDVEALLAQDALVVVATDRGRSGTNLLVLDADQPFTFRFGPGSLAAHEAEADARGLSAVVVQRAGTAVDLDTLDDWSELPPDVRSRPDLADLRHAMNRT